MPRAGDQPHVPDADLRRLANEGYSARPSDIQARNPTAEVPGQTAEKMAGSAKEADKHIANNQVQTTRLGGQVLGLRNATSVTESDVLEANKVPGRTYDIAGQRVGSFTPTPEYQTKLQDVAEDPNAVQAGVGKIKKAAMSGETIGGPQIVARLNCARQEGGVSSYQNAMEDELERQLNAQGKDGATVLANLRGARKQFARNYAVRDALDGDQVNAGHRPCGQSAAGRARG